MTEMDERPKIDIEPTSGDNFLEIVGWTLIILAWALTLINYPALPESIPTHFNVSGQADNYGSKSTILILPILGTILFAGLTLLNRYPNIFNYPVPITPENAERQYRIATRLVRYLKFILVVTFSSIEFRTIRIASGKASGLGSWFLPVILGLVYIPIAYFIYKAVKSK